MVNSLKSSTVEAFAEKAGITETIRLVCIESDRFTLEAASGNYIAQFREGDTPVAKFFHRATDGTVKFLTKEQAIDTLRLIRMHTGSANTSSYAKELNHLSGNLPSLSLAIPPLYNHQPKPAPQNAKNWVWSLNLDT